MIIGFTFKKAGLFALTDKFICPSCKKKLTIITHKRNLKTTQYGYDFKEMFNCSCGYSANFIIKKFRKIESQRTFKRTCKECSSIWSFNANDVLMEDARALKSMGKSLLEMGGNKLAGMMSDQQIGDFNRCNKCGSRKVNLELVGNKEKK